MKVYFFQLLFDLELRTKVSINKTRNTWSTIPIKMNSVIFLKVRVYLRVKLLRITLKSISIENIDTVKKVVREKCLNVQFIRVDNILSLIIIHLRTLYGKNVYSRKKNNFYCPSYLSLSLLLYVDKELLSFIEKLVV